MKPFGFVAEFCIPTKGHNTKYNLPCGYKVDLGNPKTKLAIEVDGPSHYSFAIKKKDRKKQRVLESLGWTVLRLFH